MATEHWPEAKSARVAERVGTGMNAIEPENGGGDRRHTALRPSLLLAVAVLLVAANLRPAVTGLSPVLDEVRDSLRASAGWASVLTALPGLCFGLAGFLAPLFARRLGIARAVGASVALLVIGLLSRVVDGSTTFLIGTLVGCIGIAVCNVLLPVVVKESYPNRIGLLTGLYTASLQGFAALASWVTPPVAAVAGGWRSGLGVWGLLAALGLLVWSLAARHGSAGRGQVAGDGSRGWGALLRSPLAWMVTVFFGLQAMFAYACMGWLPQVLMSAGVDRTTAGLMMAIASLIGVPISLVVAPVAARRRSQSMWVGGLTAVGVLGVLGLLLAPAAAPWLWIGCLGIGMGVFALAVALISLRTRSAEDTRALSTMSQSIGYLLAAVGPLVFGMLHGLTGSWSVSLVVMLAGVVVQVVVGVIAGRPRYV